MTSTVGSRFDTLRVQYNELKAASTFDNFSSMAMNSHIESSVTPYIIEERQLNVAQMDVFSRLMMDRIIFMGTAINDQVANIIQAQLLFLESTDALKTFKFILILQEEVFMPVLVFMILCSL